MVGDPKYLKKNIGKNRGFRGDEYLLTLTNVSRKIIMSGIAQCAYTSYRYHQANKTGQPKFKHSGKINTENVSLSTMSDE